MLISLPYPRAGLCHYLFSRISRSFRISSPFINSILSNIMTLSNMLFLRALLFFALATISLVAGIPLAGPVARKLVAGNPVPEITVPATFQPIEEEIVYLTEYL
jgi:hypothetical protein